MDDLVERVARAINSTAYAEHEEPWAKDRWPDFLDAARIVTASVLDAIAEPNNEQIRAAIRAGAVSSGINQKRDVGTHYRAMIAALRKEMAPLPKSPSETS